MVKNMMWYVPWESSNTSITLVRSSPLVLSLSVMIMLPTFDCVLIQPGGHLLLMITRTPLTYLLTIVATEYILGQVARGIYLFQVYQPYGAHRLLPKVFVTIKSRQERLFMPVDNWCVCWWFTPAHGGQGSGLDLQALER